MSSATVAHSICQWGVAVANNTEGEIRHLIHKLFFLARLASDLPETPEIMGRIRDALETVVDDFPRVETDTPPTVAAYFLARFGEHLETWDESDPEHQADPAHAEFSVETRCGEDCRMAIDAAVTLIDHIKAAFGDDRPDLVAAIVDAAPKTVRGVVLCYVYG
jgi:hypothetical protein